MSTGINTRTLACLNLSKLSFKSNTQRRIVFFADDTSLYASHNAFSLLTTQRSLQHDLDEIHKNEREWVITFSTAKTIQQTFSHKRQNQPPRLTFGDVAIPINKSHKHLGMIFSNDLRFHKHVNEALTKANKTLSPLYAIAKHLPRHILDQIFKHTSDLISTTAIPFTTDTSQ